MESRLRPVGIVFIIVIVIALLGIGVGNGAETRTRSGATPTAVTTRSSTFPTPRPASYGSGLAVVFEASGDGELRVTHDNDLGGEDSLRVRPGKNQRWRSDTFRIEPGSYVSMYVGSDTRDGTARCRIYVGGSLAESGESRGEWPSVGCSYRIPAR